MKGDRLIDAGPIDIGATLRFVSVLPGDPTVRLRPGRFDRATATPEGAASLRLDWRVGSPELHAHAWGPGGDWLLERVGRLVGLDDDVTGFEPADEPLRGVWKRHRHHRITATGTLWHDLSWFIVQQRVTQADAARQWKELVRAHGEPAPGPVDLLTPPSAGVLGETHYTEFHRFGIERQRSEYLRTAARLAPRFASAVDEPFAEIEPRLQTVRGLGPWTRSCLAATTWGDPDAVIVGDDGIPSVVTWFLAREERGTDARMLELLEPYRPHRARVVQLAMASGERAPRRRHRGHRHQIHRH